MGDNYTTGREPLSRGSNVRLIFFLISRSCEVTNSSRYLVEGPQGAVLHTGDFRAEPWFLDSLVKEPVLQKYLATPLPSADFHNTNRPGGITTTLEAIYLDTACLLNTNEIPTKVMPQACLHTTDAHQLI